MQGDNAWIFASEDQVSACVKAFMEFEKGLKADIPKDKRAKAKPTDITGTLSLPTLPFYIAFDWLWGKLLCHFKSPELPCPL